MADSLYAPSLLWALLTCSEVPRIASEVVQPM